MNLPEKNDAFIQIKGAKEHNLKNISVRIPRESLTIITGLSGSGKSSLAFDTIFAEGQRRYVESLSNYARQFIPVLDKPDVESIEGLSPAISIEQKTTSFNPRSTVGTVTEVYDYLRLLFSKISKAYCEKCNEPIQGQTSQQILDQILEYPEGSKVSILAPVVRHRKGEYQKELLQLQQKGFSKAKIDGITFDLGQDTIKLDKQKFHSISVYVDRILLKKHSKIEEKLAFTHRLDQAIQLALKEAQGILHVDVQKPQAEEVEEKIFSINYACLTCGYSYPNPEPRTFSFNSPIGACSDCDGLGYIEKEAIDSELDEEDSTVNIEFSRSACPKCKGSRLKSGALIYKIKNFHIAELCELSIEKLSNFFEKITLSTRELLIAERILKEIHERLFFLKHVGVGYLSLNRSAKTLSGGESQRIRLASQIGASLNGVIYVLDEPSIGLHQRDNQKLLEVLKKLKSLGNTVLVVEHDEDTIQEADYILDMGPGAGSRGGEVIAAGTLAEIMNHQSSLTGKYLSKKLKIPVPHLRRAVNSQKLLEIAGINKNNLKNVDLKIPLGLFTCITGVSGSGKSTLIIDTLYPLLAQKLYKAEIPPIDFKKFTGFENVDKVIDIDQKPIGRTPRSNPCTFTGVFSLIRDLFSSLPESKIRGYKPGRFSFNVKGGRCERCEGDGYVQVNMHLLVGSYVKCEACQGKRYNLETLSVRYKGKSIADVLNLTIEDALSFFENIPTIKNKLQALTEVGLGYIALGQSAITLSGGEAQRLKLAKDLSRKATGKTIYILDEPTTGLHFEDVKKLIDVLQRLVDQGNTVLVIEHHLDLIKCADHIIDLGPEGGEKGGSIVVEGAPEQVAKCKASYTGQYLKKLLN